MPSETIVFGDLARLAPVYYVEADGWVVWATAAEPLGALVDSRPILELLACNVALSGIEPWFGDVPLEKVRAVRPGWLLRIGPDGVTTEPWHVRRPPATLDATGRLFGRTLSEGVARRCGRDRPVGAGFSGSVDSGTLTALAARSNGPRGVVAVTHVGDQNAPDLDAARALAKDLGALHVEIGDSGASLRYAGLEDPGQLPHTDLPSAIIGDWSSRPRLVRAAELGAGCYLSGLGGDEVLAAGMSRIPGLIRSGGVTDAVRRALQVARFDRASSVGAVVAALQLRKRTYEQSARSAARRVRGGGIDPKVEPDLWQLRWITPESASGWLTDSAAEWVADRLKRLSDDGCPYPDPLLAREWERIHWAAVKIAGLRSLAASVDLELELPYLDNPILELWEALPGYLREPEGTFKPLVTLGMAGMLPAAITDLRRKDRLGIDNAHFGGIARHADAVWRIVDSSVLIEHGVFDRAAVSARFELMLTGTDTALGATREFLASELWLAGVDLRRQTWWQEPWKGER
jgi:asparagine synthetase B (glutamine-hydrolysing)